MLRKLLVSLGVTAGLLALTALPATADAHPYIGIGIGVPVYAPPVVVPAPVVVAWPVVVSPVVCRDYDVLYRCSCREPWRVYASYSSPHRAHHVGELLEARGYEARVVHR